jgi:hypothetical protein
VDAAPAAAQRAAQPAVQQQRPIPADAYASEEARELVRLARIRRAMVDRRIEAYEATVIERISAGLGLGVAERLLYRRETASRVNWTADTVRIEVLGAREVLPGWSAAPHVPAALAQWLPGVAFDPVDSEMLLRLDNSILRHPLVAGSEADYRFAAGDSTVVRLPDGRVVRLRELRITPRRQDPNLIAGSFWLDLDTHAVVQAYFRLARGVDSRRGDDIGPPLMPTRMELEYIAIDYGLWEQRWWLPRTLAAAGVLESGPFRVPVRFERRYDDYRVTGTPIDLATLPDPPAEARQRLCRPRTALWVRGGTAAEDYPARVDTVRVRQPARAPPDTGAAAPAVPAVHPAPAAHPAPAEPADTARDCDRVFLVARPAAPELLASELLPGGIYDRAFPALNFQELETIAERLRRIPATPWSAPQPVLQYGLADGLARYNRVEGLSVGVRPRVDFGPAWLGGEFRVGTAGGELGAQLGAGIRVRGHEAGMALYRRLDVTDVAAQPFGIGSSLGALLLGRDDHDYFRATGAELTLRPALTRAQWYELRLFGERQQAVAVRTDFHLLRLAGDRHGFRPNIAASTADQFGAVLRLRASGAGSPRAPRWAGALELHGEAGDYAFARPAVLLRGTLPIARLLAAGIELRGGTTFGAAPVQRAWQLGGVSTVRGYAFGAATGDTYWTARGEAAFGPPFVRLVLFGDMGWAGPRDAPGTVQPLRSAGVGLGVFDGVFRIDIARAERPRAWRAYLRLNGLL